jgi:hypothetical protein
VGRRLGRVACRDAFEMKGTLRRPGSFVVIVMRLLVRQEVWLILSVERY